MELLTFTSGSLIPHKLKLHTVSNSKALNSSEDILGWQGRGSNFTLQNTYLKSTNFVHVIGLIDFQMVRALGLFQRFASVAFQVYD